MTEFTEAVYNQLKNYVYRLIDPRDGSTFYVGRGRANRVFEHVRESLQPVDHERENERLETIRKIKGLGLKPIYVIHRHGMSEREAKLAEAVLIDAYPGLTNIVAGEGSNDYGPANAEELALRYGTPEIQFDQGLKIMIIKTTWSKVEARERRDGIAKHDSVYEAVRSKWRVSKSEADQADYVLAIIDGICRGVYVPQEWKEVPMPKGKPPRWEFDGRKADQSTWDRYMGKRIPGRMRKKGMANPVLYEGY